MFYDELLFLNNSTIHVRFVRNLAVEKISNLLQAKGMNPEVALSRASKVFGTESEKASLYLHNLHNYFNKDLMHKVYEYISNKALFQEQMQFNSYDQMLGMMQNVYKTSLSEEEIKHIRHISQANHYGIALVR